MRNAWRDGEPVTRRNIVGVAVTYGLAVELAGEHDRGSGPRFGGPARIVPVLPMLDLSIGDHLPRAAGEHVEVGYALVLVRIVDQTEDASPIGGSRRFELRSKEEADAMSSRLKSREPGACVASWGGSPESRRKASVVDLLHVCCRPHGHCGLRVGVERRIRHGWNPGRPLSLTRLGGRPLGKRGTGEVEKCRSRSPRDHACANQSDDTLHRYSTASRTINAARSNSSAGRSERRAHRCVPDGRWHPSK